MYFLCQFLFVYVSLALTRLQDYPKCSWKGHDTTVVAEWLLHVVLSCKPEEHETWLENLPATLILEIANVMCG